MDNAKHQTTLSFEPIPMKLCLAPRLSTVLSPHRSRSLLSLFVSTRALGSSSVATTAGVSSIQCTFSLCSTSHCQVIITIIIPCPQSSCLLHLHLYFLSAASSCMPGPISPFRYATIHGSTMGPPPSLHLFYFCASSAHWCPQYLMQFFSRIAKGEKIYTLLCINL